MDSYEELVRFSDPDSKQAEALIRESFPPEPSPSEIVLVRSDRYTVDPEFQAKVRTFAARKDSRTARPSVL